MTRPSASRVELRRALCSELMMPFFRRYNTYLTSDSDSSSDAIVDADLTQDEDFWKGMWYYCVSDTTSGSTGNIGAVRLIDHFQNSANKLLLEYNTPVTPSSANQCEIHTIWNAFELHNAINRAIQDAYPAFYDIVSDETLVVQEDTTAYSLSALTYRPWVVSEVWVEQPTDSMSGTATSSSATSLVDTSANFTNVTTSGWYVSIYDGTGKGQLRAITSRTGTTQVNVAAWTTNPDTTSKYRVWDSAEQRADWYRMLAVHFDRNEYPTTLYFTRPYSSAYGCRIRIVYASDPLELTAETSTTVVPKEFIINKAVEILAASRVSSARADREQYAIMEQSYRARAENYRERNAFRLPTTMWQEHDPSFPATAFNDNPLGWS